ncbi:hypothetical protein BGX33_008478 [Mortierella sp. NVP41]|nr:hypothetical protein BGX33_008478 [Mortierella sp. NVP41]
MSAPNPKPPTTTVKPTNPLPKPTNPFPKPITTPPKPTAPTAPTIPVVPKPTATTTASIITVAPPPPPVVPSSTKPTYTGGPIITVTPNPVTSTSGAIVNNNGSSRGQGSNIGSSDEGGMSAAAIGGLVAGLAVVLVGSVVGGFLLLKQRRKRMMFVGLSAGASRPYGGDGYPDPPDLPRPPRAGFQREDRPGSGAWSGRSGYSGPPSSFGGGSGSGSGRRPFTNSYSDVFDEKGYHANAAGLGGARMSVMGPGGPSGYSNNVSGESFTQLHDGRFVANGRRGDGSQGGYNGGPVVGDVDHYPNDGQEYDVRHKEMSSSSAAFLPSPPSSPEAPFPPESLSPTDSSASSSARLDCLQPSSPLGGPSPAPSPRASGYHDNNHPIRSPSRPNMSGPPLSPPPPQGGANFVNRSHSRASASILYAPDGLPLFPPRPVSHYQQGSNYQYPGQQQQPYYPGGPRSPPPMGSNYYSPSPRLAPYGGPNFPPPQHQHPYTPPPQQQRFLQTQQQHQPNYYSSPTSPMTSPNMTTYEDDTGAFGSSAAVGGGHSPQKYANQESFERDQGYKEIYVHPPPTSVHAPGVETLLSSTTQVSTGPSAPQTIIGDDDHKGAEPSLKPTPTPTTISANDATAEPTDLATLTPVVPAAESTTPPPVPLKTKPSVNKLA